MTKRSTTSVMSVVIFVIGIVLIIETLSDGGGAASTGVLLGVLFAAAGAGRLYIGRARR
jgi:hypothetical protein